MRGRDRSSAVTPLDAGNVGILAKLIEKFALVFYFALSLIINKGTRVEV
jgi:hypothetical protein